MSYIKECQQISIQAIKNERVTIVEKTANEEFDELIGLASVKEELKELISVHKFNQMMRENGGTSSRVSMNYVFTGNPGTAKTTAARLFAKALYEAGITKTPNFIETSREGLVGRYCGETAQKTKDIIEKSIGGVLFIDEAYSLSNAFHNEDNFGKEAIDTLTHLSEVYNDNLCIIAAGYKKEMNDFLNANSGLKSRFANEVNFPDYNIYELIEISEVIAESKGFFIAEDAKPILENIFKRAVLSGPDFGNGRFARNIVDKAIKRHAFSLVKTDSCVSDNSDLYFLNSNDFYFTEQNNGKEKIVIGFR